jgi:hypothetical protein
VSAMDDSCTAQRRRSDRGLLVAALKQVSVLRHGTNILRAGRDTRVYKLSLPLLDMPVGVEAWFTQIPPITRGWLALSVLTSLAVVRLSFSGTLLLNVHDDTGTSNASWSLPCSCTLVQDRRLYRYARPFAAVLEPKFS